MRILAKRKKKTARKFKAGVHKFREGDRAAEYSIFELSKLDGKYKWKTIKVLRYKFNYNMELLEEAKIVLPQNRRYQYKQGARYLVFHESDLEQLSGDKSLQI